MLDATLNFAAAKAGRSPLDTTVRLYTCIGEVFMDDARVLIEAIGARKRTALPTPSRPKIHSPDRNPGERRRGVNGVPAGLANADNLKPPG